MADIDLQARGKGPRASRSPKKEAPRRTIFFEDGLHVGTIMEYVSEDRKVPGFCMWSTAYRGDRAPSYQEAYDQMIKAVQA